MTFKLTTRQEEARTLLAGPQRHTCLVGGSRSGKTFLICRQIMTRAVKAKGSRHAILRYRGNAARASIWLDTLPKVREVCYPRIALTPNRQDGYFELPNKSQIWIGGLDEKERVEKILGQEYCVDPSARVLTADLYWRQAGDLKPGDELIAFPEDIDGHCKLQSSTVERSDVIQANRYRVITDKGSTIVSVNHRFVAHYDDRRHRNYRQFSWRKASELQVGDVIRFTTSPWDEGTSKEDGWFAGMLDGEGWVSRPARQMGVAQVAGPLLDALKEGFRRYGIEPKEWESSGAHGAKGPCYQLRVGLWPALRALGIARPKRLDGRVIWDGCRAFRNGGHGATIISIEPLGVGPVVALQTSTKTLICDGFLGHNCTIFLNECSQIPYSSVLIARTRLAQTVPGLTQKMWYDLNPVGRGHWTNRQFGPDKVDPQSLKPLVRPEQYARMFLNPRDNLENLTQEYIDSLDELPERQRRRFFLGEYVDEIDGALWTLETIEQSRCEPEDVPQLVRVVVAVDPSGTAGEEDTRSDAVGIGAVGLGTDGICYVFEDATCQLPPAGWGYRVWETADKWGADCIVGEVNFGGEMVKYVLESTEPRAAPGEVRMTARFKPVVASRGKHLRAEPVSSLYDRGRVKHVGRFPQLEDEMLSFSTAGYLGERSPNRADWLVMAITELAVGTGTPAITVPAGQFVVEPMKPPSARR